MAGCPVLESFLLTGRSRFECIRINSRSLVSLGLRVYTDELVIEDAPLLERLLQVESRVAMNLSVVSAPKLETVGCLCDLDFYSKLLAPEATVLQELSAVSFGTVVSSVKTLAINIPSLSIGVFVDLMRCFPCLETLYIQDKVTAHKNLWQDDVIKSLDIRLKTVVLRKYQGTTSQINLATFFVLNAKMLELMVFDGRHCGTKKFMREQRRMWLPLEKRASSVAQFDFRSTRCYHFLPRISHVRDLSKPDLFTVIRIVPFETRPGFV
ncbi:hypothetical protein HU200_005536 [Digitaria exilis]|uniref:FBD domain-containing protein n=1 Tax=Digitaria exilis TaxID=1010633 RepID=A0A835KSS2_9POAL|nr:hypothetical protein HU200_005536 [Digitaria exilis]